MCHHNRFARVRLELDLFWQNVRTTVYAAWGLVAGYFVLVKHELYAGFTVALLLLVVVGLELLYVSQKSVRKLTALADELRDAARATREAE